VANDSGDGDDLFEDLDKFFAPIKDVDWDEPEGEPERTPPASHVEVRQEQPPAPEPEEAAADEAPVEDVWYDAGGSEPTEDDTGEAEATEEVIEAEVVVLD